MRETNGWQCASYPLPLPGIWRMNMSENTAVAVAEQNGEAKRTPVEIKLYSTLEEANSNRPAGAEKDTWKVFKVTRPSDGGTVYLWSVGYNAALYHVAKEDGYEVTSGEGRGGPRKPSGVPFAVLASLDDAVLAGLGLEPETLAKIKASRPKVAAENAQASAQALAQHQANPNASASRRRRS